MTRIKKFVNNLSKSQKIFCLIVILGFILFLSIGVPSLARFKNRVSLNTVNAWDGTVATSYRSGTGTESDPYIISTGAELAYFASQLNSNDYENKYFTLSNDIVLNKGIFSYSTEDGIKYYLNDTTYYLNPYSNKYYDNKDKQGTESGTINLFNSLNNFKGTFDGKSYRIYGLYLTDQSKDELALFTNLKGTVKNLYVENSFVYGGNITAGIASTTDNASISDTLYNGYVFGKNSDLAKDISLDASINSINVQTTQNTNYIDLSNDNPFNGSSITSTSVTGSYTITGGTEADTTITINGNTVSGGTFDIDLGTSILNNIPVTTITSSSNDVTVNFSNLKYNINYTYGVAGGIIGISKNSNITNTVNKADVYGYSVSGGIIGATLSTTNITHSYNTGKISSNSIGAGIIGSIEKNSGNVNLKQSYNSGDLSANDFGGLLGVISNNTGIITLTNVFNTSSSVYSIGTVSNSNVVLSSAYFINGTSQVKNGTVSGDFTQTTLTNLESANFLKNYLSLNEFISFSDLSSNSENVWVFEKNALPISYIDDISKPIASIHVSTYSWNNLSTELNNIRLQSNITFSIQSDDELNPAKEIYYYISNSKTPLTADEVKQISSWSSYTDINQITTEGVYIIYAKIVDYDDNVTYANTDTLILDLPGASGTIKMNDNTWNSYSDSNLKKVYVDRQTNLTVTTNSDISNVSSIKYYISTSILSKSELNGLSTNSWQDYTDGITLNDVGTYIIYIKLVDDYDYTTYLNTDYIVYNGYSETNFVLGHNSSSYDGNAANITSKSAVTMMFSYSDSSSSALSGYTHNIVVNNLLPIGTKLTLIDYITNKVYEYQISTSNDIYGYADSCNGKDESCIKTATYPLTLFKEIGTSTTINNYPESTYYNNGKVNESFKVTVSFADTDMSNNYTNLAIAMNLLDNDGNNVRPTLFTTIKNFNIYAQNSDASLYLNTDYSGSSIDYNSDSSTDININSGISYKVNDVNKIIDTTYEDKQMGLSIKMVDSSNNTVDKEYLKNLIFQIGDNTYSPGNDNIIRINLGSAITDISKTLTIKTYKNNNNLVDGTYYIKIANYSSYDGYFYDSLSENVITIPVVIDSDTIDNSYSFDAIMDDSNRIINKDSASANVAFNVIENGTFSNPNIRISLYKKDELTAYNQNYSIVDLADYTSSNLNLVANKTYYVTTNPISYDGTSSTYNTFNLNLSTANFDNTGYKFVFDLYDGNKKIGSVEKYFIVK